MMLSDETASSLGRPTLLQRQPTSHVTRTPLSRSKRQRSRTRPLYSPPCWRVRRLQRCSSERVGRGKLLLRCRLLGGARHFGAHGGGEGRGISWRPPAYNLLQLTLVPHCGKNSCQNYWIRIVIWICTKIKWFGDSMTFHPQKIS